MSDFDTLIEAIWAVLSLKETIWPYHLYIEVLRSSFTHNWGSVQQARNIYLVSFNNCYCVFRKMKQVDYIFTQNIDLFKSLYMWTGFTTPTASHGISNRYNSTLNALSVRSPDLSTLLRVYLHVKFLSAKRCNISHQHAPFPGLANEKPKPTSKNPIVKTQ